MRIIIFMFSAVVMMSCATMMPAPAGGDSSLIIGKLNVEVNGMGIAPNGAEGWVVADFPSTAAITLRNEADGKDYEIRTATPDGFFMLANAAPGRYRLIELWAQVKAEDAYVTITSDFNKALTFDVEPGRVANLGTNDWYFSYNLTSSASQNRFVLNGNFAAVESAFLRFDASSPWTARKAVQASFSGEASARPMAVALPPRTTGYNRLLLLY